MGANGGSSCDEVFGGRSMAFVPAGVARFHPCVALRTDSFQIQGRTALATCPGPSGAIYFAFVENKRRCSALRGVSHRHRHDRSLFLFVERRARGEVVDEGDLVVGRD
jgi:hypothetical protein